MLIGMIIDDEDQLGHSELIRRNLFLVEKIVRNFQDVPGPKENLENAGHIGLLNAANLYDRKVHKMDFKSYAQVLITQEIHQYLTNRKHKIDQPGWLIKLNQKILQFIISYQRRHQKFPQISEIADHINIKSSDLQEMLKSKESVRERYLIYHLDKETKKIQSELERIRNQFCQNFKLPIEDVIALQKALLKLKEIEYNIIYYIFIMDLLQTETVKKLGISEGMVEQMEKEISDRLS